MSHKKEGKNGEEYESILKDRKLKYEKLRNSSAHNRFTLPIINFVKCIVNFVKAVINILTIFFKTLFGLSNDSNAFNGTGNDGKDDFHKKKKMGNLQKSKIMELKNLGTCLGNT
ncbi:hypothetical protein POVCU2_0044550 [Plasmodium ovale curtisi]|uniref:Selenoprotein n=1 Tax=Plasmodium ovale curtisi TaxID=864141 RepID=A0A1A8W4E7_PLAOA|nr:hypothetical protein POVCU2_0044550 [Plasmodium ovale curtisi]SBS97824.1 hypothetical protein POVCU1_041290 [Plasmodium ovale curtisi]